MITIQKVRMADCDRATDAEAEQALRAVTGTERIEVRDWYQDAETAPACVIMVKPGADLTESQIRKVRAACPNWTRDIEEYAQDADGRARCRVARRDI